jgi:hypothetical protein
MLHCILPILFGILAAGCDPQFPSDDALMRAGDGQDYSNDGADGGDNGDPDDACAGVSANGLYVFSVSASSTDPFMNTAAAPADSFDFYVWLVETDLGLSAVEFDVSREGADLQSDYFTPAGDNLFLTWEGSGEVDLAVAGCPSGPALLGTIHLAATADSVRVNIVQDSESAGAVDCGPCYLLHDFSCTPFASD